MIAILVFFFILHYTLLFWLWHQRRCGKHHTGDQPCRSSLVINTGIQARIWIHLGTFISTNEVTLHQYIYFISCITNYNTIWNTSNTNDKLCNTPKNIWQTLFLTNRTKILTKYEKNSSNPLFGNLKDYLTFLFFFGCVINMITFQSIAFVSWWLLFRQKTLPIEISETHFTFTFSHVVFLIVMYLV